jgi:hypothetical protein
MYGIGQLGAYGAALMALSPLAGLLHQLIMYLFNGLVEQPHLQRARA